MPLHFSRVDQSGLLASALDITGSTGWAADAVAFSISRSPDADKIAVIVFQRFEGRQAEMHIAPLAPGAITRPVMDGLKTLIFSPRGLGLTRIWTQIAASNRKTQALALMAGAEIEYRKRAGIAGGEDAIVFSMAAPPAVTPAARASD